VRCKPSRTEYCYSITAANSGSRASCPSAWSRYTGGPSRNWIKTKCPSWKRANVERHRLFEGPPHKSELTEAEKTLAKKRQELARVIERLRSPPLSHGIARELRKQQTILEREIAELDQA
jgi:hypothetical protein